ncbi:threonine/serine ThrE exporter family protein [Fusobacterium sp. PH5-44]|uniref:threonine/serine ThrE exporter family protein n=1 Tax=unclassified Fusobacterium TaxID=2648384 RepID=UPI003D24E957
MEIIKTIDKEPTEKVSDILYIACNIGKLMLQNGGETYRAEETIVRTCGHYNVKASSFATLNTIITSTDLFENKMEDSRYTVVDRINFRTINLDKVAKLNDIARNLDGFTVKELKEEIKIIMSEAKISHRNKVLGHVLAGGSFAILFKGTMRDSIVAVISMLILSFFDKYLKEKQLNSFFNNLVGAMLVTIISLIFVEAGFIKNPSVSIIAALMLLAPGISFTNSIRDIISGDFISGVSRAVEALTIGVALAAGSGVVLSIWI